MSSGELRGVDLKIYLHLLHAESPLGVREISRDLGIPVSTVHYHVRKLKELGLVRELSEGYEVSKKVKIEGFIYLGRKIVPRLAVYSAFFAGIAAGLLVVSLVWGDLSIDRSIAMVSSMTSSLVMALESYKIRKRLFS